MSFPTPRRTYVALAIGVAATSALVVVGPGSTAATAGRLLGSAGIKNNSIRSIDIRNSTITGKDVKNGSLTAQDFSGKLRGATGPRGPAGPASAGAGRVGTWHVASQASSAHLTSLQMTSVDTFPSGTQFEDLDLAVAGDFSSCTDLGFLTLADPRGQTLAQATYHPQTSSWDPARTYGPTGVSTTAGKLTLTATCLTDDGSHVAVPTFDARAVVSLTKRVTTPTVTIH